MEPITLALMLAPYLIQGGMGLYDASQANKYNEAERPPFDIPPALLEAVDNAQMMATQRGTVSDRLRPQLEASSARSVSDIISASPSSASATGAIGELDSTMKQALKEIETTDYNNYIANQAAYMDALGEKANMELQKWQWDQANPYLASQNAAQMFEGAARQELSGALTGLAGVGAYRSEYGETDPNKIARTGMVSGTQPQVQTQQPYFNLPNIDLSQAPTSTPTNALNVQNPANISQQISNTPNAAQAMGLVPFNASSLIDPITGKFKFESTSTGQSPFMLQQTDNKTMPKNIYDPENYFSLPIYK